MSTRGVTRSGERPVILPTLPVVRPPELPGALCAEVDPELFFPEKGQSPKWAKWVCHRCPHKAACLEFALDNDERFGVWGGTTARERRRLARGRRAA
ncbi:MAG: WhiB family transcriptional regulator [Streptosporangiales bacterium]